MPAFHKRRSSPSGKSSKLSPSDPSADLLKRRAGGKERPIPKNQKIKIQLLPLEHFLHRTKRFVFRSGSCLDAAYVVAYAYLARPAQERAARFHPSLPAYRRQAAPAGPRLGA